MTETIAFIGSGNVASHMAQAAFLQGYEITDIWSRRLEHAQLLASKVKSTPTDQLQQLHTDADLYIIAVPDDYIDVVAEQLCEFLPTFATVVHTSGATSLHVLSAYFGNTGVIWPLQSLSLTKKVDFQEVPLCITSNTPTLRQQLLSLCHTLSRKVQVINEDQKQILHLAAVFANNFSNHMYTIAHDLCSEHRIDFDLLKPLINETAAKISTEEPSHMQTGPAVRNDEKSIATHLQLLSDKKSVQRLYQKISENIQTKSYENLR